MKTEINNEEENIRKFTKGNEPFSVPKDYFEKLPDGVMGKINAIPAESSNPFDVPKGYFNSLSSEISEKIADKSNSIPVWKQLLLPQYMIPASLAVILIIAGFYFMNQKSVNHTELEFTTNDLQNSTIVMDIEESLIVEFISDENIATEEYIEEYLIENNIEYNEIENEL
jgi:hypothetical protein